MPTKLIEVALPLDVINKEAAREKSIRHGHPSTLHLWWARRPLAACRAVLFAQLVDDPSAHPDRFPTAEDQDAERQRLFRIIERLVLWDSSNDESVIREARAEIRRCYPDGTPTIIDPFCGGGSIPVEAQRLGLKLRASDINPVAVLITKALVELPAKFAERPPVHPSDNAAFDTLRSWSGMSGLADDVKWYGTRLREVAETRIGHLYPKVQLPNGGEGTVVAWLWARTVTCPNPACGATAPLARTFWLGKRKSKEAWLRPVPDSEGKRIRFEIGHESTGPPVASTVDGSGALCLMCRNPMSLDHVKSEGQAGRLGRQLLALAVEGHRLRYYLEANSEHESAALVRAPQDIPDSLLSTHPQYMGTPRYGIDHHSDLFTNRQLIALCTLSDLILDTRADILRDSRGDTAYADAVTTYLAFVLSKTVDRASTICGWEPNKDRLRGTFQRQAIPMSWDFAEGNIFGKAGGDFGTCLTSLIEVIERLYVRDAEQPVVEQQDARSVQCQNGVVSTDPPYYDNVPYSDLADFFYVWLRRSIRSLYPDLLGTILTPKEAELVADSSRFGGHDAAETKFEEGFTKVFARVANQSDASTPIAIFYAFRQSDSQGSIGDGRTVVSTGWEKMLQGLLSSGLAVTGTWPMRTELSNRMRSMDSNALASSIVLVCRPRTDAAQITDRRGFQQALRNRLGAALRNLQSGGVAPVDLAQAAIGPGMAVFSSYVKVVEPNGDAMSVRTALALINQILDEVTAEQEGEFDGDTRWAVAWYGEHGMDDGPFGRADDLSRAKNVSVEGLVRAGIVKSGAGKVRLLERSELDPDWDPATDVRLTIWEVTQQLIRRLLDESEASAADLLGRVGGLGEPARDLAYRLFQIAESKKWAKEAGPYNALAAAWPELSRRAALGQNVQETLI